MLGAEPNENLPGTTRLKAEWNAADLIIFEKFECQKKAVKSHLKHVIWILGFLAFAGTSRAQESGEANEALRRELAAQLAEEKEEDEATVESWKAALKELHPPFDDSERRAMGVRLTRLSKSNSFHVPKEEINELFEAYRRKIISDSEYLDWCVSLIHEEKQSALATGQVLMFRQKAKFATNILSKIRTDESARALGALLADTRGSLREPPYTNQPDHDYWSLAGTAVSALHAMDLEDPPEVEDERLYGWPEALIGEWQAWWAEVERGEREIRFKDEGAVPGEGAAGARRRPAPADRPGALGASSDAAPPSDHPAWLGWTALGLLAGLIALYIGLRRFAGERPG